VKSVIKEYLSSLILMLEEALFVIFGEVIYDIGVKRILLAMVLILMAVAALIVYRIVRRRFAARFEKLDRIAAAVEENSRMLRQLLAEKDAAARDAAGRNDTLEPGG